MQRIRLARQLGAGLQGVLYILDEPSIGLHPRDNKRLLEALFHLRDSGNSVIVIEHDEETIRMADHIVDIGPGAGKDGGEVSAVGTMAKLVGNAASLHRSLSGASGKHSATAATSDSRRKLAKNPRRWRT